MYGDDPGWGDQAKEALSRAWLWTAVSVIATVFLIAFNRKRESLQRSWHDRRTALSKGVLDPLLINGVCTDTGVINREVCKNDRLITSIVCILT